jgi:hypothetical protein
LGQQPPLHPPADRPSQPATPGSGEIAWPDQQFPWAMARPAEPDPGGGRRLELIVVCLVVAAMVVVSAALVTVAVVLRDEPAPVTAGAVVPTRPVSASDGAPDAGPAGHQLAPVEIGTTATFESGLEVGIGDLEVRRAKGKYEKVVLVPVTVTNRTGRPVDLFDVEVTARLGPEQRPVPRFSGAGGSSSKAGGTLPDGRSATLEFAFRIEHPDDADRVTVTVWPDWATGSATFTGSVTP